MIGTLIIAVDGGATITLDTIAASEAEFVLTGVSGPAGPIGAKGDRGNTGPVGATGATGATGDRGDIGPVGATGSQGIQGLTGAKGDKGDKGDTGPIGPIGAASTVPGPKGDNGGIGQTYTTPFGVDTGTVFASIQQKIALGAQPNGARRHWMNNGGENAAAHPVISVNMYGGGNDFCSYMEAYRFADDPKSTDIQIGKSRGNGDLTDIPGYHKDTQFRDRLAGIHFYGSYTPYDGAGGSWSHACQWIVQADGPSNRNSAQPTMVHFSNSIGRTNGNGIQYNSLAQVAIPGPNQAAYLAGADYKAVLRLGKGGVSTDTWLPGVTYDMPPLAFTAGTKTVTPVPGAIEYDENGNFSIVEGTTTLARKRVVSLQEQEFGTYTSNTGPITMRKGVDWVELTITPTADFSTGGTSVARFNTASGKPFPAVPAVVGSFYSDDAAAVQPTFIYQGNISRLFVLLQSGTLRAGCTYTFTMIWRLP